MKYLLVVVLVCLGFLLSGCSSESNTPAPAEKPQPKTAEAITGRTAFQKLYISARGWARDAQPYRLQSDITGDAKGRDGKTPVWRGYFASPSQRATKPYTWAKGDIEPGTIDSYSPSNSSTQVFDIAFLNRRVELSHMLQLPACHSYSILSRGAAAVFWAGTRRFSNRSCMWLQSSNVSEASAVRMNSCSQCSEQKTFGYCDVDLCGS